MGGLMKAIVKREAGEGAEIQRIPIPQPKADQVLIKVKAASICGTDVHIYRWDQWAANRIKPPLVFGHEFAGEIVEIGSAVKQFQVGDYVSAETHLVCGQCQPCLTGKAHVCQKTQIIGVDTGGCFAEYMVMPERNLWRNHKSLPPSLASMQEPLGNAVHTVLSGEIVGKRVVVLGCGPIGLMAIAVAKACGAAELMAVDINDYRLRLAANMGAEWRVNSREADLFKQVEEWTGGEGADVVLEMSGHPQAIQQGLQLCSPGGRMSLLGLPASSVELNIAEDLVLKGIQLHGIAGRKLFATWFQAASLASTLSEKLHDIHTHTFSLDQFKKGFELMNSGKSGKVVLLPGESSNMLPKT